jgi:heat shock protein HslJ
MSKIRFPNTTGQLKKILLILYLKYTNEKHLNREKKMKKSTGVYFCTALILPAIIFVSCAGTASARGSGAEFKNVQGKEWTLLEIKSQGKTVRIDRKKLETVNLGGAFTINFEDGRASGVGAPNRYFGPYTVDSNNVLSIGNLASTMMAALFEPEELRETEFLDYLSKVKRWNLRSKKLELYSVNSAGAETVLVFESK